MNGTILPILQYGYAARRRAWTGALAAAVWLAATVQLPAAFEENVTGARARAMAGAFTAIADTGESVFLQPAGLAFIDAPALSLTYGKLLTGLSDDSELNDGAAAVCLPVCRQCGLGFGYKNTGLSSMYREETAVAGGAWRPLSFIAAGAAVKYLRVTYGKDGYTAIDPVFASGYGKTGIDFDAGVFLKLSPYFNLAWSRQNLAGADMGLKEKAPVAATDHLGLTYVEDSFMLTLESVKTDDRYRFLSAAEKWFLHNSVALRCGFGWGDRDFRRAAAGLGVSFDRFTVDYALEYPLSGIEQVSGTHYVTLSVGFAGRKAKAGNETTVAVATAAVSSVEPPVVDTAAMVTPGSATTEADIYYGPVSSVTCTAAPAVAVESTGTLKERITDLMIHLATAPAVVNSAPEKPAVVPAVAPKAAVPAVQPGAAKKKAIHKETPVVHELQPAGRPGEMLSHRTAAGDTLPGLAERYYGDRTLWMKIYNANRDRIEKGALRPGEILVIPPAED